MTARVLVLHAYSAENAGDGLLVHETLALIHEAIGESVLTVLAARPDTFDGVAGLILPTVPGKRGWDRRALDTLRRIDDFDLVVAVGGGYLRAGRFTEALKMLLVHGLQLRAASRAKAPTIYLPQSIGPLRFGMRAMLRRWLMRLDAVYLRDDRSIQELHLGNTEREPDLAAVASTKCRISSREIAPRPVLSIRAVGGKVNPDIYRLASYLPSYDGYIQSVTGGNDDRVVSATLGPVAVLGRDEFLNENGPRRVVIAVRLHAALMALAAGHYVVHLAYERKGYGAFDDLGISDWVHSVNHFDKEAVLAQANELLTSAEARDRYDRAILTRRETLERSREQIVARIREAHVDRRGAA